ncbi:alkaline phosphatase PhoX, partial [Pseudomonas aeruginosa]
MSLEKKDAILFGDGDELPSNHSNNPHMNDLIAGLGRRQVLAGGAALGALAFLGVALPASAAPAEAQVPAAEGLRGLPFKRRNRLPFEAIASGRADTIRVPAGYKATPFIPWGTPISGSYPGFLDDASNSAQDQAEQIGMHHDG